MKQILAYTAILWAFTACSEAESPLSTPVVADFRGSKAVITVGDSVRFSDLSTGMPTRWKWTFEGGKPTSSTEPNPTVSYETIGVYGVSLMVSNQDTDDEKVKSDFITVEELPIEYGLFDETMTYDGRKREYLLYVPESYDGKEVVPLVFSLHGALGSKEKQYDLSRFHDIADTANFILVTPEATVPNLGTFWNHESDPNRADDVGFINALMDEMISRYLIDPNRIYAAGSSNGGYMCLQLACELSDRIAAVAAVKGVMNEVQLANCNPAHPSPILQLHGTDDRPVSYDKVSATLQFWVDFNQTDILRKVAPIDDPDPDNGNYVEYILYDNGREGTTVAHFKVVGGEHDWFGEPGTHYDIDASQEAWKFFSKHDLNGRR